MNAQNTFRVSTAVMAGVALLLVVGCGSSTPTPASPIVTPSNTLPITPVPPAPSNTPAPTATPRIAATPTAVPPTSTPVRVTPTPVGLEADLLKAIEQGLAERWTQPDNMPIRNVSAQKTSGDDSHVDGTAFFEMSNFVIVGNTPVWVRFSIRFNSEKSRGGWIIVRLDNYPSMLNYVSGSQFKTHPDLDSALTKALEQLFLTEYAKQDERVRNIRFQKVSDDGKKVRVRILFEASNAMEPSTSYWSDGSFMFDGQQKDGRWAVQFVFR